MSRITYQFRVLLAYAIIVFIVLAYTGLVSINVFTGGVTTLLAQLGIQQSQHYAKLASEMVQAGMSPEDVRAFFVDTGEGSVSFIDTLPDSANVITSTSDFAFQLTPTENRFYLRVPELDAYLRLSYQTDLEALMQGARRTFIWEFFMIFMVTATVGFYLTWFTLRQVRVLREGLQRIGRGNFSARLQFRSHDEFGELAAVIDRTAEQLQLIQQERKALLNRVSHELKTPVSVAINLLYVASRLSVQEDVKEKIETARKHLLLQARLVNDILQTSGIQEGMSLDPDLTDARTMLEDAVLPYKIYLDSLGIKLTMTVATRCEHALLEVDSQRIRQVFGNIIHNAARHLSGQPSPTLDVSLSCDDRKLLIRVTDNGPGISSDIIDRIFDPYVSAADANAEGMGGSGLGLAISKDIVEAHGGKIGVESPVAEGRGACLIVQLPRLDEEVLFQ